MIKPKNAGGVGQILLEFTQGDSVEGCFTHIAHDIHKVDKTKTALTARKSLWVVGVHPRDDKTAVRDTVERIADRHGIQLFDVYTRFIRHTGYAFTIF
jgi:hypothetical protein